MISRYFIVGEAKPASPAKAAPVELGGVVQLHPIELPQLRHL